MTESEKVIRTLYKITSAHNQGFEYQVKQLLKLGLERFHLDIGILSQINENNYTVVHSVKPDGATLKDGDQFELGNTFCALTIESDKPTCIEHAGNSAIALHPAYKAFALESYIGTPIIVNNDVYGTLNFSSPTPHPRKFLQTDIDTLQLMGSWIGTEIERREQVEHLRQSRVTLDRVIQLSPTPISIVDKDGFITFVNAAFESLFGYESWEVVGESIELIVPQKSKSKHIELRHKYVQNPTQRNMNQSRHLKALKKDGTEIYVEVLLNPITTPEGFFVISTIQDITTLKQKEHKLAEQVIRDELTGLYNRRILNSEINRILQENNQSSQPVCIALFDIDHFKNFNDKFGHVAGDHTLQEIGSILNDFISIPQIAFRYGGEEFLLILPDMDDKAAQDFIESLRLKIQQHNWPHRKITASFGVTTILSNSSLTIENIIEQADQALYHSKANGRNCVSTFSKNT